MFYEYVMYYLGQDNTHRRSEFFIDGRYLLHVNGSCSVGCPIVPTVGTGPDSFSSMTAWHHGAGEKRKHGSICRDSSHNLRRNSLVTTYFRSVMLVYCINVRKRTSDHNTSIHRLCANHLLRIHTHQISQKHARRV